MPRAPSALRAARLPALALLLGLACSPAGAVCPSAPERNPSDGPTTGKPSGTVPPGLRKPFDPPLPPQDPVDAPPSVPPPEPADPPPGAPAPPPGPTTPPATPVSGPEMPGASRGRLRPRGDLTLDDLSWQTWWGLHRADVLPVVRRQVVSPDGHYARLLPSELRGAVDVLLLALADREPEVRWAAAGAFAGFRCDYRAGETIEALRATSRGTDRWLRDLCHLALGVRQDVEAIPRLRTVLRAGHEEDVSRAFAALALIELGPEAALDDLAAMTQDLDEPDIAGCVLIGLGAKKEPRYLPLLLEAARRRSGAGVRLRRVRSDALTALGTLAHPSTAPYLGGLLADPEDAIARSAAIALGGFRGSDVALGELRDRGLASGDPWVRALSCISLGRLGLPSATPVLMQRLREEPDEAVRPFVLLSLGLLGESGATRALGPALLKDPRDGAYGAAALAAGLLRARELRAPLEAGVDDTRTHLAPACGALGLGLLGAVASEPRLRTRFWLDSTRVRPGFDEALALLAPERTATWLCGELAGTQRESAQGVLVDALARAGGPHEGASLVALYRATPAGSAGLRVRILWALAAILRDREVTRAQRLLFHGYYLQPNPVLGHLALLP